MTVQTWCAEVVPTEEAADEKAGEDVTCERCLVIDAVRRLGGFA
jgi:hypothetical protein